MKIENFTILRSIWLRGDTQAGGRLYRESDGKQCCLGIYLKACGVPVEIMADVRSPAGAVTIPLPEQATWLVSDTGSPMPYRKDTLWNSQICSDLMDVNDKSDIDEREREQEVARLFARQGITVQFVG